MNTGRSLTVVAVVAVALCGGRAVAAEPVVVAHVGWLVPELKSVLGQTPVNVPLEYMTREQLMLEKRRLEDDMPGLAGPIILVSAGAGSILVGTYYIFALASTLTRVAALVVGGVIIAAGVTCAVIGIVWLVSRLNARAPLKDRIIDIDQKLDAIYYSPPGARPSPVPDSLPPPPPPPPPMPPPSAGLEAPPATMVIAQF